MKRHMIRPILGLVVAGLALGTASRALADGTNVGYVDLQKALMQVDEGKAAKAQLQADFKQKQAMLNKQQDDLRTLKDDLDKRAATMDPAKRKEKQEELQRKFLDLQQTYVTLQKQLTDREKQLTDKIFSKMAPILSQIARENNLDLILEKSGGILWAKDSLDLTNELVRRFNAKFGKHHGSAKHHKKSARHKNK